MNSSKLFILVSLSLAVLTLVNCNGDSKNSNQEFVTYIESSFKLKPRDGLFIIIPKDACKGCKDFVYNHLWSKTNNGKVSLIYVGNVEEAYYINYNNRLKSKGIRILNDPNNQIHEYAIIDGDFPIEHIKFVYIEASKVYKSLNLTSKDISDNTPLNMYFNNYLK